MGRGVLQAWVLALSLALFCLSITVSAQSLRSDHSSSPSRGSSPELSFLNIKNWSDNLKLDPAYSYGLSKYRRRKSPARIPEARLENPEIFADGTPNPFYNELGQTVSNQDTPMPQLIKGISEIADRYDAFILDQYGVLHNGQDALPGAKDCFDRLIKEGKRIVILSNTSRRSESAKGRLPSMGFDTDSIKAIVSSGEEAWRYLKTKNGAKLTWLTWSREVTKDDSYLEGLEVQLSPIDEADFILCHGTELICTGDGVESRTEVSYMKNGNLSEYDEVLTAAKSRNLEMVVANPDIRVQMGDGSTGYMPGGIAAKYELMGGKVTWFGKPYRKHFESCLREIGDDIPRERVRSRASLVPQSELKEVG
mmetsp:Transcript_4008/g.6286  ORF Transcript_4008/g.6286 Transcript_4008/m.6286 type:complete len:366 (-) Transcript_4008:2980-4077(-)